VAQVGCGLGEILNYSVNPRFAEGAQLPLIVSSPKLARTLRQQWESVWAAVDLGCVKTHATVCRLSISAT